MPLNKRIFLIVALLYVTYLVFPLFADTVKIPAWVPSMFCSIILFALFPQAFANRIMFWFCAYAAILSIYVIFGKPLAIGIGTVIDSKRIFIEFAFILPAISIFSVLRHIDDPGVTKKFIIWSSIILYLSFLFAIPLMMEYNSLREALQKSGESLNVRGLPSYSLMHAYTLLLPITCYAVKITHKRKRLLALAALSALCFVIYDTFVTTSLLVMLFALVLTIGYTGNNKSLFAFSLLLMALVILILNSYGVWISLIDWALPTFKGTPVEEKLIDIRATLVGGEITGGTIEGRQSLHGQSWKSFLEDPLFGNPDIGGHSALLDRLGGMGLIATIPFVMIIVSVFRYAQKILFTNEAKIFLALDIFICFIFIYEKGLWGAECWICYATLTPMAIATIEKAIQDKQQSLSNTLPPIKNVHTTVLAN